MNPSQSVQDQASKREQAYSQALRDYLLRGGEDALQRAYEIGRIVFSDGLGVLEISALHHAALMQELSHMSSYGSLKQHLDRAQEFFSESLCPYEMAHRGFRDSILALHRLNETLEQEIQRIAHAVHDEAGQLLFAARLAMSGVAQELDPSQQNRLQEVRAILDEAEKQLRRLSHEIRPTILDDLGLVPALRFLTEGVSTRADLPIRVVGTVEGRYAPKIETAVYRIVQEALTNITKHAQAKNVEIELSNVANDLQCLVRDDGVGFDVRSVLTSRERSSLGLVGIRERLHAVGGTLQIDSVLGRGTELLVKIPVEK